MTSFQKIYHFFINNINDGLYYYVKGKRTYKQDDMKDKSASRDFLFRQLRIQLDEVILQECKQRLRKGEKDAVESEIERILSLMDIQTLSVSFNKDEWKSITRIFLKVCELKFTNAKTSDEWQQNAANFISKEIQLSEEESSTFDLINN